MIFLYREEINEREFPSPSEWRWWTRRAWREANRREHPEQDGPGSVPDWTQIGQLYMKLLERLENPELDGQGLRPALQEDGDMYVDGVGKAGFNITSKSEPWRHGYFAVLMACARAAEDKDDYVKDATRNIAFPKANVIGSSNPSPKPVVSGAHRAPCEEDCVRLFDPPETYYMKILTTRGFSTRQRLDAALAYADWLDFQGLSSTAEEMYDWGLDIAMGAQPLGVNTIIDIKTGVIDSNATQVSSNALLATTRLAQYHARNGNLTAALPVFLSVLRARRQLPVSPTPAHLDPSAKVPSPFEAAVSFLRSMLISPPHPLAPPSGDEAASRTPTALCEEAAVMAHIGEILFASHGASSAIKSPSNTSVGSPIPSKSTSSQLKNQQSGLGWTREAVELAESTLEAAHRNDFETRNKCSECLSMAMDNWQTMISKLIRDENEAKIKPASKSSSWWWGSKPLTDDEGRWERESKEVNERLINARRLLNREVTRKEAKSGFIFMGS
ncbi:hypothetical protein MMC21_002341 [Puttea exsequens]|nr:hypothetical protein [Puttea exsequens]